MKILLKFIFLLLSVACLLSSCSTSKNIVYFQDLHPGESEVVIADSLEN